MMSKKWKTFRKHCFDFTVHAILYVPSTEEGRWNTRSSRQEVFLRKVVLRICSKFTGEHPYRSAISIKLHSNFIEITFRHGCSPVNLLYIFRIPFLKNTSGWLFLKHLKLLLKNETRNSVKTDISVATYNVLKNFYVTCVSTKMKVSAMCSKSYIP